MTAECAVRRALEKADQLRGKAGGEREGAAGGSEEGGVTWQAQPDGTWPGTGREGGAQLCDNLSQEVSLVY